jgi:hypothetical protein
MVKIWDHVRSQGVAYVALFVALGGTALAAGVLPPNSVGTKQLRNGAVTGRKVAKHSLTGANINLSKLGTVPSAARLGGRLPAGWQRLVSGSCLGNGAIAKINSDGSVACQAAGTGTLTGVGGASGSGITGGGTSGSVTLGIDPTILQHRLIGGCQSGQAITSVAQDGTPSCQAFGSGNGTITGLSNGTGLTGGGTSGNVSLALAPGYQLPQGCAASQVSAWSGTAWVCSTPATGTITGVTAGTDLTGGGSSGPVTLNADETKLQHRVSGTCSSGLPRTAIASVGQDGSVGCVPASVTQMTGGSIGTLNGSTQFLAPEGVDAPTNDMSNSSIASALGSTGGNLEVDVSTAPGSGASWTITLFVGSSATNVSCTISDSNTSCSDTTHAASISAGAVLAILVQGTNAPAAARVTFGWTDSS